MKRVVTAEDGAFEVRRYGLDVEVSLCYPRINAVKAVQVALMDVRAADNVRLWYDFERDGWVVEQASTFEWDGDDADCDPDWQEVALVPAWGRKPPLAQPEGT